MAALSYDDTAFRQALPAFADTTQYPELTVAGVWDIAAETLSPRDYGWLRGPGRLLALNLMTAHLLTLAGLLAAGDQPGVTAAAGVDKVTVTLTPPPLKTQWQWWLSTTAFGAQLWALLQARTAGGFHLGGRPEAAAFRRAGGYGGGS